jgi:phosphoglycolate phosphatase
MIHLIWDLDGTLIDSQHEIILNIDLALQDAGLKISDAINPIKIGPPLDVILRQSFQPHLLTEDKMSQVIKCFRKRYDNSDFKMTVPFDGIEKIVKEKKLFIHHIVTNKPYYATKRIINKIGWSDYFATITTSEFKPDNVVMKENRVRSKIELFADLILKIGDDNSLFVGIGDTRNDCFAAKSNNIRAFGVLWGAGTREELSDCCDCIFDNTEQLGIFLYKIAECVKEQ